jgi:mannonate dehydratase
MQWDYRYSYMIDWDSTDLDLKLIQQLGVKLVYVWVPADKHTVEDIKAFQHRLAQFDLVLHNVLSHRVAKCPAIQLNLPGRDEAIDEFIKFLYICQAVGLKNTTFTWEPDAVWSTADDQCRSSQTRQVISDELKRLPLTHQRNYTSDELWDNFAYFMKRIIPECEKTGIRLAMHPNDPPVDFPIAGVPCLITSADTYRRAFKIANSPFLGMEFCCGCWLEGGQHFGPLLENLTEFIKEGRVFIVHLRNVSSTLPNFKECFLDNGYFEMYKIIKLLCDLDYAGTITLDHTPQMADGAKLHVPKAYATGYMRALAERAIAEKGGK